MHNGALRIGVSPHGASPDGVSLEGANSAGTPACAASLWTDLLQALSTCSHRLRDEWARYLKCRGASDAEFALLWACRGEPGGMHQAQIASHLVVSPAHVSQLAEQLRARSLLESRRGAPDRRRQYWMLTSQGGQLIEEVLQNLACWAQQREVAFGAQNREALLRLLQSLHPVQSAASLAA